jgi:hypothetical protein
MALFQGQLYVLTRSLMHYHDYSLYSLDITGSDEQGRISITFVRCISGTGYQEIIDLKTFFSSTSTWSWPAIGC